MCWKMKKELCCKYWRWIVTTGLSLLIAAVFLDSLRFKFTLAPETQEIFSRLEGWANSFDVYGLFLPYGAFGPFAIGSAEAVATILLLVGALVCPLRGLQVIGAKLAMVIMTGAIFFHLFTPLGVVVNGNALLFTMACVVWVSAATVYLLRMKNACNILKALSVNVKICKCGAGCACSSNAGSCCPAKAAPVAESKPVAKKKAPAKKPATKAKAATKTKAKTKK